MVRLLLKAEMEVAMEDTVVMEVMEVMLVIVVEWEVVEEVADMEVMMEATALGVEEVVGEETNKVEGVEVVMGEVTITKEVVTMEVSQSTGVQEEDMGTQDHLGVEITWEGVRDPALEEWAAVVEDQVMEAIQVQVTVVTHMVEAVVVEDSEETMGVEEDIDLEEAAGVVEEGEDFTIEGINDLNDEDGEIMSNNCENKKYFIVILRVNVVSFQLLEH